MTTKIQSKYAPENTDPLRPRYMKNPTLPEGEKLRKENKRSTANEIIKANIHANIGLR